MSVRSKVIVKKHRGGNVLRIAREHYLRDDLFCGAGSCVRCTLTSHGIAQGRLAPAKVVYIPDTFAILEQVDVVWQLQNILFLQTTLKEVRGRNAEVYDRVKQGLASSEKGWAVFSNENRRECYVDKLGNEPEVVHGERLWTLGVKWLDEHWTTQSLEMPIVVLRGRTGDYLSLDRVQSLSVQELVKERDDLAELYAQRDDEDLDSREQAGEEAGGKKRKAIFPDYIPERKARAGIRAGRLFQGVYHPSAYNYRESYVGVRMDQTDRSRITNILLVGRESQNRAIDGDVVVVEILPKSEWVAPSNRAFEQTEESDDVVDDKKQQDRTSVAEAEAERTPTGRVVAISKRNWRPYCGAISSSSFTGGDGALFVPIDRKIPRIHIRSRRIPVLLGKRLVVVVHKWDRRGAHPSGHVVKEIGESGDKEAETQVLLIENEIPTRQFSASAMACLPEANWAVTEEHINSRWDLRNMVICSVDPPGCTDIDDALHCRRVSDTEVEVGIHIADVTAFVRHGSALDNEAAERGTTVYLVDRRIEMLPGLLSSNLCSLQAEVERLAFSCIIRMDDDGSVKRADFGRSVIKSKAALTYAEAQSRIDTSRKRMKSGRQVNDPVSAGLVGLADIAQKLRDQRMKAGALVLASPEVKFKISEETDAVTDVHIYETYEANRMVEEFMLLANCVVAERILKQFPHCAMLRRHPKPSQEMFEPLLKVAKAADVKLDVSNSKNLNESLSRAAEDARRNGDAYLGTLLRILATRCMTQAVYFSSGEVSNPEFLHYGLAAPVYTHFTSPIRRYADVLVHRLLSSCLGYSSLPMNLQDSKRMQQLADVINERHRCAQYASRASVVLHTVLLFRDKALEEPARIMRILANGLVVLIPRYGVEGVVQISEDRKPVLDELKQILTTKDGMVFKVLSTVHVRIRVDTAPERRDRVLYELV